MESVTLFFLPNVCIEPFTNYRVLYYSCRFETFQTCYSKNKRLPLHSAADYPDGPFAKLMFLYKAVNIIFSAVTLAMGTQWGLE